MSSGGGPMKFLAITLLFLTTQSFADPLGPLKLKIGKFESRAYFTAPPCGGGCSPKPAVILIPGSGAHGPEERMPAKATEDGKEHSLFDEMTEPLLKGGFNVLALGKPGVDFFTAFGVPEFFYDKGLFSNLKWKDLIENVREAYLALYSNPLVDTDHIYLLGHSEGTQVAIDYASAYEGLKGLILLGYFGDDMASLIDWQFYQRLIDFYLKTDCDKNHDRQITQEEAKSCKLIWQWKESQTSFTFEEFEAEARKDSGLKKAFESVESSPLYSDGIFKRGNIDAKAARLKIPLYVFNGELDVQTTKEQALRLKETCEKTGKKDCMVERVPGLGHGYSRPRAPRRHPLLDATVGGISADFQTRLETLAVSLKPKR
jgi:uncharacterized protein